MVLKIFAALAGLVKVRLDNTIIDSHVFRLHYRWTTSLCFIACALIAATEYIGDPIQCTNVEGPVPKAITTYCWIESTFTINTTDSKGSIPGAGNEKAGTHERTYHSYYQWVPFVLFFQGCLFYLPHLLWKSNERKTAHTLLQGLNLNSLDKDRDDKIKNIVSYLKASKGRNFKYSVVYIICEALNFVNTVGQMFLLDAFFNGAFLRYGVKALNFALDEDSIDDPFRSTFPKIAKCTFVKYGPSGGEETRHPLCILPQNILNEKVFVIMWFWFVILANITIVQVVWRLVLSFAPVIRVSMLQRRGKIDVTNKLDKTIQRLHLGDYFLLDIIGRNLDACTFTEILTKSLMEESTNGHGDVYAHIGAPDDDDDDPTSYKRKMESNNGACV